MAHIVIKTDGTKVPFNAEKMKSAILGAAMDTELSEKERNEVVEQVSSSVIIDFVDKQEISTDEIEAKILHELDNVSPIVAKAWRDYEETKKKPN
ncbi:MAG: ATP cone domain-containing protein [Candidatus Paceibacterales bacterium]